MINSEIDKYLTELDHHLGEISVSERADIIIEIKSHLLEAKDQNPGQSINQILTTFGSPSQAAQKFLQERGLGRGKPKSSSSKMGPVFKWTAITILGLAGIFTVVVAVLVWKFTPILNVDEKSGRVKILGGLIDISETEGTVKVGKNNVQNFGKGHHFDGSKLLGPGQEKPKLNIKFSNGDIELTTSETRELFWSCSSRGQGRDVITSGDSGNFNLDFSQALGIQCQIKIPESTQLELEGANGKVEIIKPKYNLQVNLVNGLISLSPDKNVPYRYTAKVSNGNSNVPESSNAPDAFQMGIKITNGSVQF